MADTSGQGGGNRGPGGMTMPTFSAIGEALRRGDIVFAAGVIAILAVLILPMPTWLLDFCLALSILLSVLILMTVMFIRKPLDFSAFPTILLVATMMRLALNLASTRLILGEGHNGTDAAGHVIQAFGNFMMAGNPVIGVTVRSEERRVGKEVVRTGRSWG